MKELIYFIYSGRSPNLRALASDVLKAADRFHLVTLKDMADQMLRTQLSADNVCRYLLLADMCDAPALKQECLRYITEPSNKQHVMNVSALSK